MYVHSTSYKSREIVSETKGKGYGLQNIWYDSTMAAGSKNIIGFLPAKSFCERCHSIKNCQSNTGLKFFLTLNLKWGIK